MISYFVRQIQLQMSNNTDRDKIQPPRIECLTTFRLFKRLLTKLWKSYCGCKVGYENQSIKAMSSPGWCGSVDWVPACELKGHWFNSQSWPMPGLWARSPVGGAWEATTHWCFSPLCPPLSKNKVLKKNKQCPHHLNKWCLKENT